MTGGSGRGAEVEVEEVVAWKIGEPATTPVPTPLLREGTGGAQIDELTMLGFRERAGEEVCEGGL